MTERRDGSKCVHIFEDDEEIYAIICVANGDVLVATSQGLYRARDGAIEKVFPKIPASFVPGM